MTFKDHLDLRLGSIPRDSLFIDYEGELVTFPLYSLTGLMVGFQRYNWKSDKKKRNDKYGKYWTYQRGRFVAIWGLEFYDKDKDLYVCEGIFDACRCISAGLNAVAVLGNNPKHLKSWFYSIPNKTIALCDGDKAGRSLAKLCDKAIHFPDGRDAGDMTEAELEEFIRNE